MPRSSRGAGVGGVVETRVDMPELAALLARSKAVQPKLATALRRNIRNAGKQLVGYVRTDVLSGSYQTDAGLRSGIAAGLKLQVSTAAKRPGVRIVASSSAMPDGKQSLVRAWQSKKGWRHPVYGRDAWVQQSGNPYFFRTITEHRAVADRAVVDAMRDAVKALQET